MAISVDVLATALQEQFPGATELFTSWHPLFDEIIKKGNKQTLKGPWREFVVVTGGPGDVKQIVHGSENIPGVRNQNAKRGNAYAPRLIYHFDVPGKDLSEANGPQDLARILKLYPEMGLADFHERLSRQLATGDGANVGGFPTFNANTTFSPDGVALDGLLQALAPASQTKTVHGLNCATTTGWQNQYGAISGFGTDGLQEMRRAYYKAQRQGKQVMGKVDLIFADEESYLNYLNELDDPVRITHAEAKRGIGDSAPNDIRSGVMFEDAKMYLEDSIDTSATAYSGSAAANGVFYMLNTATWELFIKGHDSGMETKGDFEMRGPFRIPDQDAWRTEYVLSMGLHTISLRHNAVVTGGATP